MNNNIESKVVYYIETPKGRRLFAKLYGSVFIALGIIIPSFNLFMNNLDIIDCIFLLIYEVVILTMLINVFLFSFEEITKFLILKLTGKKV